MSVGETAWRCGVQPILERGRHVYAKPGASAVASEGGWGPSAGPGERRRQPAVCVRTGKHRYFLEPFLEPLCPQYTSATCDIFFGRLVTVGPNGEDGRSHHVAVKVLKGQDAKRHLVAELKGRLRVPGGFASDELWREALDLVSPDPGAIPVIPQTGTPEERIVPVLDFGRGAEHGVFLVLPKKDGTLLDSLQRERWAGREVERVRDMAKQLAEALKCLHDEGIVHADLKPRNVTASRTDTGITYQLIDLDSSFFSGCAHTFSKISSAYCAPEQFREWMSPPPYDFTNGDGQLPSYEYGLAANYSVTYDFTNGDRQLASYLGLAANYSVVKLDSFALGVVLFEAASGERLFLADVADDTLVSEASKMQLAN